MAFPGFEGIAYDDFIRMVESHYGKYSETWWRVQQGVGFDGKTYVKALNEMPGVSTLKNHSGKVIGYGYKAGLPAVVDTAFSEQIGNINSNINSAVYGNKAGTALVPTNAIEVSEGMYAMETGARTVSTGAKVLAALDRLSLAAIGVSAGAKLGKVIDQTIYDLNPDWWDEHYPSINPETWDTIAGENEFGRQVINTIFGIDKDTGQLTMYAPEKLLAQTYLTLKDAGVWDGEPVVANTLSEDINDGRRYRNYFSSYYTGTGYPAEYGFSYVYGTTVLMHFWNGDRTLEANQPCYIVRPRPDGILMMVYDTEPIDPPLTISNANVSSNTFLNDNNEQIYLNYYSTSSGTVLSPELEHSGPVENESYSSPSLQRETYYILEEGTFSHAPTPMDWVRTDTLERAPIQIDPSIITGTTVGEVLPQLKTNYPDLFSDAIYTDAIDEDGNPERITYIPFPIPQGLDTPYPYIDPEASPISQARPYADPLDETAPLTETITKILLNPLQNPANNPNPAPTPTTNIVTETIEKIIVETVPQVQPQDIPDNLTQTITEIIVNQPQPNPNPQTTIETIRETIIREIPQIQPEELPDSIIDTIINIIVGNPEPLPDGTPQTWTETETGIPPSIPSFPDTGDGDSPEPLPVEGSASSLWAVYNPTQAQLNSFGAWLWSADFIEQIKRIFASPMDGVIGVHKVFATPQTGGTATIVCGFLDSEVPSKTVTSQYTTINCGTVYMQEHFGNVFDYSPFTKVSLFLPFIGIVDLNIGDIMRGQVTVIYHVDVITGACLAEVKVVRDGYGGVVYTYSGSCIVSYPLSSGSYSGIVGGVLSISAGIAASMLSGGLTLPTFVAATAAWPNMHTNVQKSGSFSGSAGAMGGKIPYLIVTRPQVEMANGFELFDGVGTNETLPIGSCSGFVRCKIAHLKIAGAYEDEILEIERMLFEGILI